MEQKVKLLLAEDDENLGLLLKEYLIFTPMGKLHLRDLQKTTSISASLIL
jgi:hypothetical protein